MIAVVVVAHRSAPLLADCLRPLLADPSVCCVVVVDNSADAATERVCSSLGAPSRLRYRATENVGYAAACNLAADSFPADIDFVAVVNPDVTLTQPLGLLAERVRGTPGCVYSALLDQGRALNVRPLATPLRELESAVVGSHAYQVTALPAPPGALIRVSQIDGSLLLFPVERFRQLDGFDDRFELYYEDVDLCRRADQLGGCWVMNEKWGRHVGGASFAIAPAMPFLVLRVSRVRYLAKWYGWSGRLAAVLVAVVEFVVRLLTGRAPGVKILVRALGAQLTEAWSPGDRRHLPGRSAGHRERR